MTRSEQGQPQRAAAGLVDTGNSAMTGGRAFALVAPGIGRWIRHLLPL